ncbi:MAG: CHAT domain-containing protein [bacterium]
MNSEANKDFNSLADALLRITTHTEIQNFVIRHQQQLSIEFFEQFKSTRIACDDFSQIDMDALKLLILSTYELGKLFYEQEEFEKAREFLTRACAVADLLKNKMYRKNILFALGHAHFAAKDLHQAAKYWQQAWVLASNPAFMESETDAQNLGNIGRSYAISGYKEKALAYYLQARTLLGENLLHTKTTMLLDISLGSMHRELGKYDSALNYYQSALDSARKLNDGQNENRILNSLGIVCRDSGDLPAARNFYQQSLAVARKAADRIGEGDALGNLGNYYFQTGQFNRAEAFYLKALAIAEEFGDLPFICRWTGNLGNVYSALAKTEKAIDHYKTALKLAEKIHDLDHCYLWNYNLGLIYQRDCSNAAEAFTYFRTAIDRLEQLRREVKIEEFSRGYGESKVLVYREIVKTSLQLLGCEEEAIGYVERGKAYTLMRMMAEVNLQPSKNVPVNLIKQHEQLIVRQRTLADRIGGVAMTAAGQTTSKQSYERYVAELLVVRQKQIDNFKEIAQYDVAFAEIFEPHPVTVAEIKEHLKSFHENTVLIEFWVGHEKTVAFIFQEDDWQVVELEQFSEGALNRLLHDCWFKSYGELQNQAQMRQRNPGRESDRAYGSAKFNWYQTIEDVGGRLFSNMWQPIQKVLDDIKPQNLILIPHAGLHLLPLHLIRFPVNERKYLVDRYKISYSPNFRMLKLCYEHEKLQRSQNKLLAVSNPAGDLFWADAETCVVASLFTQSEILAGEAATFQAIEDLSRHAHFVHFATHGRGATFLKNSLEAFVTLGGRQQKLTAQKIFTSLEVPNAHTVLLSACETGMIKLDKGDEYIGLPAAFLYAGAASVVSSLWSVDDLSTAVLIHKWYENVVSEGLSRRDALIAAQAEVRKLKAPAIQSFLNKIISEISKFAASTNSEVARKRIYRQEWQVKKLLRSVEYSDENACPFAHPYHWGGFILTGNAD